MNVYTKDYYNRLSAGARSSAERIVPVILAHVPAISVVDVGCGTGTWLSVFQSCGVSDVLGVDGDYVDASQLQISKELFLAHDLNTTLVLNRQFDLALSVEVAEHLRAESANHIVELLTTLAPIVVFSAAIPGQGGERHLNEQWPPYWSERFQRKGYRRLDILRRTFWDDDRVEWWYAQNLFLFAEKQWLENHPQLQEAHNVESLPACLVHPKNFARAVWGEATLKFCLRLIDLLPKHSSTVLIDNGELGPIRSGEGQNWLPFIEHDGVYFGRPKDDRHAISELKRMRSNGIQFVAVAWTAYWWLDQYREFAECLDNITTSLVDDDMLRLFKFIPEGITK